MRLAYVDEASFAAGDFHDFHHFKWVIYPKWVFGADELTWGSEALLGAQYSLDEYSL